MADDEFLRLLQSVEAARRVEGKPCHGITDKHVEMAARCVRLRQEHGQLAALPDHTENSCEACQGATRQEIALRELLHAEGVDLPMEVF